MGFIPERLLMLMIMMIMMIMMMMTRVARGPANPLRRSASDGCGECPGIPQCESRCSGLRAVGTRFFMCRTVSFVVGWRRALRSEWPCNFIVFLV